MTNTYVCREIDMGGKIVENTYKAESQEELIQMIRAKGHTPVRIEKEAEKGQDVATLGLFKQKVKAKDVAIFCKQMHTMLFAGMPLLSALEVLENQSENKALKATVKDMSMQVQKGEILSTTMKRHPKVFPPLLTGMVESGELTGNLDNVLERMSTHYTKENRINSKIKGAMVYPAILSILAVSVVIFMSAVIMPTFVGMFEGSGVPLPAPTRFLMGVSDAIRDYWYIFIAVIAGIVFLIRRITKTVEGKRFFDKLKLSMPLIKGPIAQIATSRFTRTLSTLLASGIPIIQALESASRVTNNRVVIDGIDQVTEDIKKGASLSVLLKKVGVFPPMMISMVGIGEESGSLEGMLERAADYYDEELEAAIQKLVSMIEPLMIVVMGVVIGFIVISMFLPMFDVYQTI
ncbi:MAG: type II secretion system F family protein [Clostridiales bacterium]|nr:type II secretion system F family protein [Clostridiales bacterium]